jgi:glycerol-3-phosphate dehydrogenase
VEDVLARRSRLLFLDARLAAQVAPRVAAVLAEELGDAFDAQASLRAFERLAAHYASVE